MHYQDLRANYINRELTAMSSCLRAVLGMAGRVAGRGIGLRLTIAGLRFRVSAVGRSRSPDDCYLVCGSSRSVIGWASQVRI